MRGIDLHRVTLHAYGVAFDGSVLDRLGLPRESSAAIDTAHEATA